MANYSLISNATFQPFTYQELAMPLDREEAYHEKLIDEYDKLSSQADVLEAMGNSELDKNSAAYSRYKNYSDTLRKAADDLSHNGLNFESRRTLSDLRRMYSKEIVPIQNAWMKREQEAKDQITALRQNPSLMFTRDAANTSLEDYIKNPVGGYGVISGANLTAQVASMAKNLEKKILSGYKENVDDATYKYVEKYGLDAKMIADWQHNPTLSKMVEQVLAANGIDTKTLANTPNSDSILKQSMGYIEMGLWNAIGEDKSQLRDDFDYRLAKETEAKKELIDYQNSGDPASGHNIINPSPLRSATGIDKENEVMQSWIKDGYLKNTPNGLSLTQKGLAELRKSNTRLTKEQFMARDKKEFPDGKGNIAVGLTPEIRYANYLRGAGVYTDLSYSTFKNWYNQKIGGYNEKTRLVSTPTTRLNNYRNSIKEGSYDTYHSTEYIRDVSSEEGTAYTQAIKDRAKSDNGKKYLEAVDFDGKNGWKTTRRYSMKDLEGYNVTAIKYSKYGNTAILQKDGEDPIRVKLPKGLNIAAETNVSAAIGNADIYGAIISSNRYPKIHKGQIVLDRNGNVVFENRRLSETEKQLFEQKQREALDEMSSYGSQFVVRQETSKNTSRPFAF
jgi:hypothetical protein